MPFVLELFLAAFGACGSRAETDAVADVAERFLAGAGFLAGARFFADVPVVAVDVFAVVALV
jgi:hypothetical protein